MKIQAENDTLCKTQINRKFYAIVYHGKLQGRTDTYEGMKTLDNLQKKKKKSYSGQWNGSAGKGACI